MDPRRLLILTALGLSLSGCAVFRHDPAPAAPWAGQTAATVPIEVSTSISTSTSTDGAEPVVAGPHAPPPTEQSYEAAPARATTVTSSVPPRAGDASTGDAPAGATGRRAIAAANASARAPSREDAFVGGVQVFTWSPGRVFEVWTAPLRVTTLTLAPGETLVAKAAGDTVRWQIGEAVSGEGAGQRTHVLLKPLERGLETNLVLTTNRRVYLIDLKSGGVDAFNAAVAWDADSILAVGAPVDAGAAAPVREPVVMPQGQL
ncbi:MAG: TrbG/VirB9 family P-type conjugative transfer protein, partial [Brevundimonas sp.]|nr:TrbG/VirB9 family P-type conjugative transfer protein [Brevundimonas sp.]